jgi:hypothetical protein
VGFYASCLPPRRDVADWPDGRAASKPHVVSLGKATPVKLFVGPAEDRTIDISVRPLYVDTKLKDFTTGDAHDVTDREFVVRRAYRINDTCPTTRRSLPSGFGNEADGCWWTACQGRSRW